MYCISVSHKTAPLSIRELFSFREEDAIEFGKRILQLRNVTGCIVVSTCNRSELYFCGDHTAVDFVEREVSKYKNINKEEILKYYRVYSDEGAVKHLFKVTCGLDSMVLGEDEILRQVKDAYQLALNNNLTNQELNIIFQGAISSSKLVKTDTELSKTPVSIGTLATKCAIEFLQDCNSQNVLLVGITGKIGSIVAKNLIDKNDIHIVGTSRMHNTSDEFLVKNKSIKMVEYKDRYQYLEQADVIISATTSPHYTFTYDKVSELIKNDIKKRLFIDLAVPGDIDKEINLLEGTTIFDIDYFEKASIDNNLKKVKELNKAELIYNNKIEETLKNVYFQKFNLYSNEVTRKVEEDGFNSMLYKLKETLNSEQLKAVLDTLTSIVKGEQ